MFGLINRGVMPQSVTDEFEKFTGKLKGLWLNQHKEDGTHGTLIADSIVVNGFPMEQVVDVPYDANNFTPFETPFGGAWSVPTDGHYLLRYYCVGRVAFVQFSFVNSTVTAGNPAQLTFNIKDLTPMLSKGPTGYSSAYQYRTGFFEWSCTDGISLGYGSGTIDCGQADNGGTNIWLMKEFSGSTARVWYPTTDLQVRGSATFLLAES